MNSPRFLSGSAPDIELAARTLAAGQLLGLPTETVYGLAADALSDAAVARIFEAKGRPTNHPLIVHLAGSEQVPDYAAEVPAFAQRLIDAFWPGPLTLILPRRAHRLPMRASLLRTRCRAEAPRAATAAHV
jgi:L-threonylcarbamoyladenylate synthase